MTTPATYSKTPHFATAVAALVLVPLGGMLAAIALLVTVLLAGACERPAPRSAAKDSTGSNAPPKVTDSKDTRDIAEQGSSEPSSSKPVAAPQTSDVSGSYIELPTATGPALLWVPPAKAARLPLLVVTHGAGGSAEWHCDFWVQQVTVHAFVLCVRGKAMNREGTAFYYPEHHDLTARLRAGLTAFATGYAAHWAAEATVYAGYSQGATMGALALPELAKDLPLALLIEGGYGQWTVSQAQRFQRAGGRRAFISCGTRTCDRGAERSVRWLTQAGVEAASKTATGAGHSPGGAVGAAAVEGLLWLTRDERDWQGLRR